MTEMSVMIGIIGKSIVNLTGKKVLAVIKARRFHFCSSKVYAIIYLFRLLFNYILRKS